MHEYLNEKKKNNKNSSSIINIFPTTLEQIMGFSEIKRKCYNYNKRLFSIINTSAHLVRKQTTRKCRYFTILFINKKSTYKLILRMKYKRGQRGRTLSAEQAM